MGERAALPWVTALANYQYAVLERQKGNYSGALIYIGKYLDFWQERNDPNAVADGLYQKAIILDDIGSSEESLNIYYSILKIYEARKDSYSVATTLNAIGEILKKTGKVDAAMEQYNKALEIFESRGDKVDIANCYYNIGDSYLLKGDFDRAFDFFNKSLALDRELKSDWGMAYDLESIGKVYSRKTDYAKALDYHQQALGIREQLGQQRELSMSYYELGHNQYLLHRYSQGRDNLLKAVKIAEEIGAKTELRKYYNAISRLYEAEGDLKKALAYKDKFISLNDSLFNETKSGQIEELQVRFDTEKKQAEILALQKDAQITELQLKRQKTLRNIIIGIALAVILFAIILFNRYTYRQKMRKESEEKRRLILEEQRKTELEKNRVAELRKIDKLKDEFLANTSHELRTPLNGIIGLTDSLKDGVAGKLAPKVMENLEMISNSGKRLAHLVNDILDFSRLKNSDLELDIRPVDLHATADVVLKLLEPLFKDKGLTGINEIPEKNILVAADENRLQQILYNLIGNSIKFTHEGSIRIFCKEKEGMLAISVSDTGIGIEKDKFSDIFKSFEQADGSTARQYGGTGLGLAVTKQLVELHGGSIAVDSAPGQGAIFTFTLPLSELDQKAQTQKKGRPTTFEEQLPDLSVEPETKEVEVAPVNVSGAHILVADDEAVNRQVLQNHLSLAGYAVTTVGSSVKALEMIRGSVSFDLLLLDVMMPEISGFEVCETLRKEYMPSELPIILLTAKNRVSDLVYGFNVGANDYLTKPFSKNELLSRIRTHLHLHSIHKAASRFVPSEIIKSVGRNTISDVMLGDHVEKEVTVLFTDVREYTHLAESMTPTQNFKFVNAYVGKMGPLIRNNKGFVNQYLGDGIMALFPENPSDALRAAIEMQRELSAYNAERLEAGYQPLSVGMGMHTGHLVMGIIGDIFRNDTAIISDTVNTASRMEGITKFYGANIILSEASLDMLDDPSRFGLRFLGRVKVKGKDKAMGIYECFDGDLPALRALKAKTQQDFRNGMNYFLANEFPKAVAAFDKVLQQNAGDKVARYFVGKAAEYTLSGVPENSDVINNLFEK
jgi:signal transduction histidine kinase/class 3 adenylate cyclase